MLLRPVFLLLLSFSIGLATPAANATPVSPLWAYNGSWKVTDSKGGAGAKPDELVNQCAETGKYFSCQQTVNGVVSALLVFVTTGTTGHYSTQSILPDGRPAGRGTLDIDGDKWTFSSSWNQGGGKTTYYKTINTFDGKTRIHFEQQESSNNKDWKATKSGDEARAIPRRPVTVR